MSQTLESPEKKPTGKASRSFADLESMIMQGRSFSGNERNCCFLNTGPSPEARGEFANVSAASGFDFPDDGRAVVQLDWDMDGDLDLWISNRNAPRLRLMRNDTPSVNQYLALRLEGDGTTTSRDAIGARVEVKLMDRDARPLVKTLRAGEGFIAQSSKWLHFGLGDAKVVKKVIVRWPSSDGSKEENVEEFSGITVGRRYRLVQGSGTAVEVAVPPRQLALTPSVQKVPAYSETARIRFVTLLPMPQLRFPGRPGYPPITIGAGKPVLLTLWASWCSPCLAELTEFTDRAEEIRSAGIEVVAMSVDKPADLTNAGALLKKMRFPFFGGPAPHQLVMMLQWYHDTLTELEQPMPIPVSFLIDADGHLAALYKGRLKIDDVLADVGHSAGTRAQRWVSSAPVPGRAIEHPVVQHIAELYDTTVYLRAGTRLLEEGRVQEAAANYREVLSIKADQPAALNNLAWLLSTHASEQIRNGPEALQLATRLMETGGQDNANYLDTLAAAQAEAGRYNEAVATAQKALSLARGENLKALVKSIEARLALYQQKQPYRKIKQPD